MAQSDREEYRWEQLAGAERAGTCCAVAAPVDVEQLPARACGDGGGVCAAAARGSFREARAAPPRVRPLPQSNEGER